MWHGHRRLHGSAGDGKLRLPIVMVSALKDGAIIREQRIYDFTGMLVQIGLLKAQSRCDGGQCCSLTGSSRRCAVITCRGRIVAGRDALQHALDTLIPRNRHLVLHLGGVDFIDSSASGSSSDISCAQSTGPER
jgi:hypothetical protein